VIYSVLHSIFTFLCNSNFPQHFFFCTFSVSLLLTSFFYCGPSSFPCLNWMYPAHGNLVSPFSPERFLANFQILHVLKGDCPIPPTGGFSALSSPHPPAAVPPLTPPNQNSYAKIPWPLGPRRTPKDLLPFWTPSLCCVPCVKQ